jgi:hypothetical protein
MLERKLQANLVRDKTIQQVDYRLSEIESERGAINILNNKSFAEHTELQEFINAVKATGGQGLDKFQLQAAEIIKKIRDLTSQNKLQLVVSDPVNAKKALETVYDTLSTVFTTLPVNQDKKYTRNSLNEANERYSLLKNKLDFITRELSKFEAIKTHQEHQRDNDKTTCPNCNHAWSKGYDLDYYNSVVVIIEGHQENIDELTATMTETKQFIEEVTEYSQSYKQFMACMNNFPVLSALWNHLLKDDLVAKSPSSVLNILHTFQGDLDIDIQVDQLNSELNKTTELMSLCKKTEQTDLAQLNAKEILIEETVAGYADKLLVLQAEHRKLVTYKKDMQEILALIDTINMLGVSFSNLYHEHYEAFRISSLQDAIRSVQVLLANKETILSEINAQVNVIKDIEKQIAQQELDDAAYKVVLKELSPTDGLIAQGLMGFINSFVNQMNVMIKKIWLYPLKVVACGLDEEGELDLDYQFPLLVQDTMPVPDVSKGSSAMREVVDLVFKLTAMKYLNLETAPLFLDEFAKALDSAHRVTAIEAVKSLMEDSSFSQLFMISHYENSYSALTNAQICVICPENIVIPKNAIVNEHVTMT